MLERPDLLHQLVVSHQAGDQTARKTALAELTAMPVASLAIRPRPGDPRTELGLSFGQAFLVQRFRSLRGPRRGSLAAAGASDQVNSTARVPLNEHNNQHIEETLRK